MTNRFNVNNPAIAGMEWLPTRRQQRALKMAAGTGLYFGSTASESVGVAWSRMVGSPAGVQVGVDIYDAADTLAAVAGGVDYPWVDVNSSAGFRASTDGGDTFSPIVAGSGDFHTFVGKIVPDTYTPTDILNLVTVDGHVLQYLPTGSQKEGHCNFRGIGNWENIATGIGGNNPTGSRVGWIEVQVAAKAFNGSAPTVDGTVTIGGVNYGSDGGPNRITGHWARWSYYFMFNPATQRQWTTGEIAEFLTGGGTYGYGFSVKGPAGTNFQFASVQIVVRYLDEKRVATGYANLPAADAEVGFAMLSPVDHSAADWAKASGSIYTLSFYVCGAGGAAWQAALDMGGLAENPAGQLSGWYAADVSTVAAGSLASCVPSTSIPTLTGPAPAVYFQLDPSGGSVDAQPFSQPFPVTIDNTGNQYQRITDHATDLYGQGAVVVGCFAGLPDAPLTVDLDGTPFVIAPGEVPVDGRWHLVTRHFDTGVNLTNGVDAFLTYTSPYATIPWYVAYVSTQEPGATAELALSGLASITGSEDPTLDSLYSVATIPPPLTGLAAVIGEVPNGSPGGPTKIFYAALSWDASGLGGDFAYYEVARSSDAGITWQTIARPNIEGSPAFNDVECLRNVEENYRVRVFRIDGAYSDWTV